MRPLLPHSRSPPFEPKTDSCTCREGILRYMQDTIAVRMLAAGECLGKVFSQASPTLQTSIVGYITRSASLALSARARSGLTDALSPSPARSLRRRLSRQGGQRGLGARLHRPLLQGRPARHMPRRCSADEATVAALERSAGHGRARRQSVRAARRAHVRDLYGARLARRRPQPRQHVLVRPLLLEASCHEPDRVLTLLSRLSLPSLSLRLSPSSSRFRALAGTRLTRRRPTRPGRGSTRCSSSRRRTAPGRVGPVRLE